MSPKRAMTATNTRTSAYPFHGPEDELDTGVKIGMLYDKIKAALDKRFIKTEAVARIIAQALASECNALIYGPAGYGKSEMVETALRAVGYETPEQMFVQFFGEGMNEARIYGNINFKKMSTEHVLEYNAGSAPGISFLDSQVAIFEELFDAPPKVLMSLKDTLSKKVLRNGAQQVPMKTKTIIAITNKDPRELNELGDSARALQERFPLRYHVRWESHQSSDYIQLFQKVPVGPQGLISSPIMRMVGELLSEQADHGHKVSPRIALQIMRTISASCSLRGSTQIEDHDFEDLKFIPELDLNSTNMNIAKRLQDLRSTAQANRAMEAINNAASEKDAEADVLVQAIEKGVATGSLVPSDVAKLSQVRAAIVDLKGDLASLEIPDPAIQTAKNLGDRLAKIEGKIQAALGLTETSS